MQSPDAQRITYDAARCLFDFCTATALSMSMAGLTISALFWSFVAWDVPLPNPNIAATSAPPYTGSCQSQSYRFETQADKAHCQRS